MRDKFHRRLHRWYQKHGRHHLPWRQTSDPYHIWLSEVMLQQTQVQTVLERFYFPFLERFPTIAALAAADLQEVLKLWQGLGYYTRAKNIHRAAQGLSTGKLPETVHELQKLPGIGHNTAHAIAVFAFHQPVAIMEANLKRVLCRIFALETPTDTELRQKAEMLLDTAHPFDYNQAMMDLGALICTPEAPQCLLCPAAEICVGKAAPKAYPAPKKKKALPLREHKIVLFTDPHGAIFIRPREGKFLHGLWEFPQFDFAADTAYFENRAYPFAAMQKIGDVSHAYTHFQYRAEVFLQPVERSFASEEGKRPVVIERLPLSRIEIKILKLLG